MKDWFYHKIFWLWMYFGMRFLGYKFVDLFVPIQDEEGDGDVVGITFSTDEGYIDKVQEIEQKLLH